MIRFAALSPLLAIAGPAFGLLEPSQGLAQKEQAQVVDLRDCPLNTVTFIDPWAGGEFKAERVGTDYTYLCPSGPQEQPVQGEECMGPYGELVLQGTNRKYGGDDAHPLFAVWTVSKAAPCCGWHVTYGDDITVLGELKNFRWLGEEEVPKLGDLPFASIDSDELISNDDFEAIFGNPKVAMMCELPSE